MLSKEAFILIHVVDVSPCEEGYKSLKSMCAYYNERVDLT